MFFHKFLFIIRLISVLIKHVMASPWACNKFLLTLRLISVLIKHVMASPWACTPFQASYNPFGNLIKHWIFVEVQICRLVLCGKKTEENTKQTRLPEFFKFNITLEWFIPFKCTICEKVFNWFHPLKTRFTKPRFSENPHLVNKSLLTRHVTKWGFDCISRKNYCS